MIKLNNILEITGDKFEYGYRAIDLDYAVDIIQQFNISLETSYFYRGMRSIKNLLLFNYNNHVNRPASDTYNFNNLLMSGILPSWEEKGISHRNKSLIGSFSYSLADEYGIDVYNVYPYNIKKGVSILNKSDIYHIHGFSAINFFFSEICVYLVKKHPDSIRTVSDMNRLIKLFDNSEFLNAADKHFSTKSSNSVLYKEWKSLNISMIDYLDSVLSADNITVSHDLSEYKERNKKFEVWTEDDCLLIASDYVDTVIRYMKEKDDTTE